MPKSMFYSLLDAHIVKGRKMETQSLLQLCEERA